MIEIIFNKRNEQKTNRNRGIINFNKNKEKYYYDLYDFI